MHRRYESKAQRAETERALERDVKVAYAEMEKVTEQLKILRERVQINEDLFKTYEVQFEGARINLLQLLQADNALFNAKLAQMNGEYSLKAAQFTALATMGKLQESLNLASTLSNGK